MEQSKTRLDRIEEKLDYLAESGKKKKEKKFKLPTKAKVSKRKAKKGFVTVELINENRELDFMKVPIEDGTIKLGGTIHAIEDFDIFYYKGKPFIHQPKKKINPWNPLSNYLNSQRKVKTDDGEYHILSSNEIYGQKYVMARMKSEFIKAKRNIGWGMTIFGLAIAGIIIYSIITG